MRPDRDPDFDEAVLDAIAGEVRWYAQRGRALSESYTVSAFYLEGSIRFQATITFNPPE
jgi:hypothetical protein